MSIVGHGCHGLPCFVVSSWQLHNPFELRRAPGGALFVVAKLKTADSGVFLEARLAWDHWDRQTKKGFPQELCCRLKRRQLNDVGSTMKHDSVKSLFNTTASIQCAGCTVQRVQQGTHVIRCGVHDCVRAILTSPKTLASSVDSHSILSIHSMMPCPLFV